MDVQGTYRSSTRISQPAARQLQESSIQRLIWLYWAWKALVLLVAVMTPGEGYDTSTKIFFDQNRTLDSLLGRAIEYLVLRLTRWDAIYFSFGSLYGKVYEQEWAFSWFLSHVTSIVARAIFWFLPVSHLVKHALAGILISHLAHLAAVTTLYRLVYFVCPSTEPRRKQLAFTTACLHILSPAGIFLSAPYGEAPFALTNFSGLLCYAHAAENRFSTSADAYQLEAFWTLGAGLSFAMATMTRSNGLLSGLILVWDVLPMLPSLPQVLNMRDTERLTRLLSTLAAGALLASGFIIPQAVAYMEYCTDGNTRPWCSTFPPSIYSFVQAHYWGVGLFKYWTLNNLPLWVLAFPVGWLMVKTAVPSLFQPHHVNRLLNGSTKADENMQQYPPHPRTRNERLFQHVLPRLAIPQLVLVAMVALSAHVQIINRISSGYPVWYLILAVEMCVPGWQGGQSRKVMLSRLIGNHDTLPFVRPEWVMKGMVMYSIVQAGLYASFLPPA